MSDDIVEVMVKAVATASGFNHEAWDDLNDYARAILAALAKEGCEVVRWRPISDGPDFAYDERLWASWPDRHNPTDFALLRGPQQEGKP